MMMIIIVMIRMRMTYIKNIIVISMLGNGRSIMKEIIMIIIIII